MCMFFNFKKGVAKSSIEAKSWFPLIITVSFNVLMLDNLSKNS